MRRVKAFLCLLIFSLGITTSTAGAKLNYANTILAEAPRWAQVGFGVGTVIICAGFTGPAAIACGLAGVAADHHVVEKP
jgi:hypothetical protein